MPDLLARSGAVAYILWGVLHVVFGAMFLMGALVDASLLADFGYGDASAQQLAFFAQHGFNLLWVGVFATVVGVWLNWRNDPVGYWVNAVVVSLFDIGFIAFVLAPGHIPLSQGIEGPLLWIAALALTTVAHFRGRSTPRAGTPA